MRYMRDRFEFMGAMHPLRKHPHPSVTNIYVHIKHPMLFVESDFFVRPNTYQKHEIPSGSKVD